MRRTTVRKTAATPSKHPLQLVWQTEIPRTLKGFEAVMLRYGTVSFHLRGSEQLRIEGTAAEQHLV
jgi:hypothetical protein